MLRKVLLGCGVAASLLYVFMDVLASRLYPGYSYADQTVSELSAVGAPTRPLMLLLGIPYTLLMVAFGFGVWRAAGRRLALRITGALLVAYGLFGLAAPFVSMHQRAVLAAGGASLTDTLHLVSAGIDVLFFVLIMGFAASALGLRFRVYTVVTVVALLVFGFLTSLQAGRVGLNQPTPWAGLEERANIYASMLWFAVLAVTLLRSQRVRVRRRRRRHEAIPQELQSVPR
jgi:Protein of unknown function (DUF998)